MAGGFSGSGAVVDDPDFPESGHAEEDLVEVGVVVDAIAMEPIGAFTERSGWGEVIDVDEFRVGGDIAVVGFCGVDVLDEVVPHAPFPYDGGGIGAGGLEFDDFFGPE